MQNHYSQSQPDEKKAYLITTKGEFMYVFNQQHKHIFLFLSMTIFALTGIGCGQNDQVIATTISKLQPTSEGGISANIALNISATDNVCVLSPYASSVSPGKGFSDDVNAFLSNQSYLGDEGHWAFIYGVPGKWTLERIRRQKVELAQLRSSDSKKLDSICGQANAVQMIKSSDNKVNFLIRGEK